MPDDAKLDLYPPIEPHATGRLVVDGRHDLYWEVSGNPKGAPMLFLHGGPGAGASPDHRRFFDPDHYRIVIFDQRGSGRSTPLGSLEDNTTGHLIADAERLREELGIDRWHVFGGSWGSTLALAYAQAQPKRVRSLALRGIFLCRQLEIDWWLYGIKGFFPEKWQAFTADFSDEEQANLLTAYHKRLTHPDPAVHMPAARSWSIYEGSCSTLRPSPETVAAFSGDTMALGLARIEAHYFLNGGFLAEGELLDKIETIRHIPAVIVQGRYDVICPPQTAEALHQVWPEADYVLVPDAGHSAMEPGIRRALVAAMERFKSLDDS